MNTRLQGYPSPGAGLRLHLNENTGGCSARVLEAIRRVRPSDVSTYPQYREVVEATARHFGVDPEWVLLTNGLDEGILMAAVGHIAKQRVHDAETIIPLLAFDPIYNSVPAAARKRLIVLCDDNTALTALMRHLLDKRGFLVQTAAAAYPAADSGDAEGRTERLVALLHPLMPHVTEEIWSHLRKKVSFDAVIEAESIMDAAYPAMMNQFRQQLIKQIRATDKIPAASRRAASMILGYDLDGTVRPQRQLSVQSAYQQAAQAPAAASQQRPMKRFQAEALQGTADRAGRETAAWREAQMGARVGSGTR